MKILLLGDVHRYVSKAKNIINSVKCDFVLQTGDLEIYSNLSKPTYFIAGNHENLNLLSAIDKGRISFENLYHIKNAEVITLKKGKEIINVTGINSNYSLKIKDYNKKDIKKCKKLRNINIFLSHEAPFNIGFIKGHKYIFLKDIKEILDDVKPKFFFFSHNHKFFKKKINTTKIFGLDYVKKEYYILDTYRDEVKRIKK